MTDLRTVHDFGDQWTRFTGNEGWYGSLALFRDMVAPLLEPEALRGLAVAEIGSGTGRIVHMMLEAGAASVLAVEPSDAFDVLRENVARFDPAGRVTPLRVLGHELRPEAPLDLVVSIGVLHHIPDPDPVVAAAFRALRPGGRLFAWLYGREGNEGYLRWVLPLRAVTTRLPHVLLRALVEVIYPGLWAYRQLGRVLPVPLRGYLENVLWPMNRAERKLVIYDQLNPTHAKYYTRDEAIALFARAGFEDIRVHHRHGYSWSVLGTRPRTVAPTQEAP